MTRLPILLACLILLGCSGSDPITRESQAPPPGKGGWKHCQPPDVTSAGTTSPTIPGASAIFTASVVNPITSWAWTFGGGAVPNTSALAAPVVTLGAVGVYACSITAASDCGADAFPFVLTVVDPGPVGGLKRLGLELDVFLSETGQPPALWYGLPSWSEADVRAWIVARMNPIWAPAAIEFDPARIQVTFVANHSEWYSLDSSLERQGASAYVALGDARTLQMGVVHAVTYSNWGGWTQATTCEATNVGRSTLIRRMSTSFFVVTMAHEIGHLLSLPHIRVATDPITPENHNLMSYGTTSTALSASILRETGAACWQWQGNPMDQLAVANTYAGAALDWE